VDFNEFYTAFIESYNEFEKIKRKEHREFQSRERFKLMLRKLNIIQQTSPNSEKLVDEMVSVHMEGIFSTTELPEENRKTLNLLKNKNYRLALISNFDHAPTAYRLLERFNIKNYFEKILISIEIGWRKPKADIFFRALSPLRIKPEDAIFVGDNFEADIIGSKSVGMDALWINKNNESIKEGTLEPDYVVSEFPEIKDIF
jgi:HAD superfamily hydrolase (TIGR01549 family)